MADYGKLLDDLNRGIQAYARDAFTFPVAEELPPLQAADRFTFARDNIQPPGALLLSSDERLFFAVTNINTSNTLIVTGRLLRASGEIVLLNQTVVPTDDRVTNLFAFPAYDGVLLSFTVISALATTQPGSCYVQALVISGSDLNSLITGILTQGYVTNSYGLSWPQGRMVEPGEGRGTLYGLTGTDPAAGAEISEVVPTNARWRIQSVRAVLVTDATVITRVAQLVIDDPVIIAMQSAPNQTQTASQAIIYVGNAAPQHATTVGALFSWSFASPIYATAGWRIRTSTANLQAGDNWGAPTFLLEEWVMP